jgi:hypothetical protein
MIKKEKNTTNSSIEEKKFKDVTLQSERQNWEQRILNEMESPHKWRETWGELFQSEVPFEYEAKIKYLEQELKKFDVNSLTTIHKVNFYYVFKF